MPSDRPLSERLLEHAQDKPIQSWTNPQTEQDKWDDQAQDLMRAAARLVAALVQTFSEYRLRVAERGCGGRGDYKGCCGAALADRVAGEIRNLLLQHGFDPDAQGAQKADAGGETPPAAPLASARQPKTGGDEQ